MNAPPTTTAPSNINLPKPGFPMLTRVVSNPIFSSDPKKDNPVTWTLGSPHPMIPTVKVVRMFVDRGGVEIYSATDDGSAGMRNWIPDVQIRLTEEAMPMDVFVEELAAAEAGDDDDDEEEEEEEIIKPVTQANGQPAS